MMSNKPDYNTSGLFFAFITNENNLQLLKVLKKQLTVDIEYTPSVMITK